MYSFVLVLVVFLVGRVVVGDVLVLFITLLNKSVIYNVPNNTLLSIFGIGVFGPLVEK